MMADVMMKNVMSRMSKWGKNNVNAGVKEDDIPVKPQPETAGCRMMEKAIR